MLLFISCHAFAQYSDGSLYSAARVGDEKTVLKILGDNPDDGSLNQALGAAITGDQLSLVKLLIRKKANVNHLSSWNNPILINAIMFDHFEAAKILIANKADVNVRGFRTIDHGIEISWDWSPLMCAARKGNLELIKLLLDKKADLNEKGWSTSPDDSENAADIAAYSGNIEVLNFLLKKGAAISPNTIFKAIRSNKIDTLKVLFKNRTDINQYEPTLGRTLLSEASWWGNSDIIQFLLLNKADVNYRDKDGTTPLMHAVKQNNLDAIKILLQNGADMNQNQPEGTTPFLYARDNSLTEILNIFRE